MDSPIEPVRFVRPAEKQRRRIPVAAIMALSFGALVMLSIGGVLALTVWANVRNTLDLLGAQSTLLVDAMEDSLRAEMGQAEGAVGGVARLYADDEFEIDDSRMTAALSGALAGARPATAMLICTPDIVCRGVARQADGRIEPLLAETEKTPQMRSALAERSKSDGLVWGSFVSNEHGLFANVSMPLVRDGATRGWVIAAVELHKLSEITRDLSSRFGTHAFILDGEDRIIADQRLADRPVGSEGIRPLMPLSTYGDPVLAAYPHRQAGDQFGNGRTRDVELSEINIDGEDSNWWNGDGYVAITRQISGYGAEPWTIGAYFQSSEVGREVERVVGSAMLGLGAMAAAVIVAILLGRRLSRPIGQIAGQATRVANFDLDDVEPLPRSRVKELDEQALAFNAMLVGLRAFSTYIPRALVAKLIRSGEIGAAEPHEAIVTVMFTDIVGFTTLSEQLDVTVASDLLNRHFALLCRAVDAHGGTVDKFLGDGMMAFFGAPDRLKGHAAAAVRAALQIREDLAADNKAAAAEDRPTLRVRIGIHTGPVVVGNIGASDRVNYTIIGDTVNVSQRLEGLGKELAPDEETAIAISAETASRLDERFEIVSAGPHRLRGRGEPVEVFLVGDFDAAAMSAVQQAGAA